MFRFVRNVDYDEDICNYDDIDTDIDNGDNIDYDVFQVYGVYQNSDYYQIVMQRCHGITLYNLIEINNYIEEDTSRVLYRQVLLNTSKLYYRHEVLYIIGK